MKLHSRPGVLTARLRNAKDHQSGEVRMNDWIQRGERAFVEEEEEEEARLCPSGQACVGRQLR